MTRRAGEHLPNADDQQAGRQRPTGPVAELDDLPVLHERPVEARPAGQQQFTAAGGQRQVHAGGRAERGGVMVTGMGEVGVPVDVRQRDLVVASGAGQAAEQYGAVTADDDRQPAGGDRGAT